MPREMTAEELVELYNKPLTYDLRDAAFVGPEQRYVQYPYVMPSREEVARAAETARNYQYTQDIPGRDTSRSLPHERVLKKHFGGYDAAMLFQPDGGYSDGYDYIYRPLSFQRYTKPEELAMGLIKRYQGYTKDLSPALQNKLAQEHALAVKQGLDEKAIAPDRDHPLSLTRLKRTAKLRDEALSELEVMYPGITDIGRSRLDPNKEKFFDIELRRPTSTRREIALKGKQFDSDADMKGDVIEDIKDAVEKHISGFESGNPQFYTQRPGYAGETLLDEARRALTYFRQMYPEDAQSARLLGRYINDVEAKYPMMQGATEFPAQSDLP